MLGPGSRIGTVEYTDNGQDIAILPLAWAKAALADTGRNARFHAGRRMGRRSSLDSVTTTCVTAPAHCVDRASSGPPVRRCVVALHGPLRAVPG